MKKVFLVCIFLLSLVLTACGGSATIVVTPAPITAVAPTAGAASTGTFKNPVFERDFADPFVLKVGDTFYGYATNANSKNVQVAQSNNLVDWKLLNYDAMPGLPTWAQLGGSHVWAPEVIKVGTKFLLFFTARDKTSDKQCVGVAVSDEPDSRFKDSSDKPLVCQPTEGGSIDPSPFSDGEKLYVLWKNDGNCCGITTYIYIQELSPDGLRLVGNSTRLASNDKGWEGPIIEAPTMFKHDEKYYLFFSGNNYGGVEYAVGYATCKSVVGPCEDAPENPILATVKGDKPIVGPGHQTLVQLGSQTWIVYHAWDVNENGMRGSSRFMWIDPLDWQNGKPTIKGPNAAPQPMPKLKP